MAQSTVGNPIGLGGSICDKREVGTAGQPSPNSVISATLFNATKDILSMRTQLTTLNAGYYTSSMLDAMTANDMVYALRIGYDSAGMF